MKIMERAAQTAITANEAEVVHCPPSGDVEIWLNGKCKFKAYIVDCTPPLDDVKVTYADGFARDGLTRVGLSCFATQADLSDDAAWQQILTDVETGTPAEAHQLVMGYACNLASQIEQQQAPTLV